MNFESDEECTADYGVFGDRACKCSGCNPKPRTMTDADREAINRADRERERDRQTSSSFNRAMIDVQREAPMTNLSDTLAALSEAATQGEWEIERDPYDAPFPEICPAGSPFAMASFTMGEDADENQANADFVVALVSAYRTGQLVPVPSVERVARVLCEQAIIKAYTRQDRVEELAEMRAIEVDHLWSDHVDLATAVIAAMKDGRE